MILPLIGISAGMIKEIGHVPVALLNTVSHVTMGSYTLAAREGNPEPTTWINPRHTIMINAIGLRNQGLRAFLETDLTPICKMFDGKLTKLRVSLAPTKEGELAEMCKLLNHHGVDELIDELEINAACPNHRTSEGQKLEPVLAHDPVAVERLLSEATFYRGTKALKIAPNMGNEKLPTLVELCDAYDITTLVSANTLLHSSIIEGEQRLSVPMGGISGLPLLDYTIVQTRLLRHCINEAKSKLRLVVGGGIMGSDTAVYLLTEGGADELQVATFYWAYGPAALAELVEQTAFALPK